MKHSNLSYGDFLTDEVNVDFDMLCALVLHMIMRKVNGAGVIAVDQWGFVDRKTKLEE